MCNKQKFDKKTAQTVLNDRKTKGKKWSREKRTYYCEECNAWHLTSMEEWEEPIKLEITELKYANKWKKLLRNEETI